VISSGLQPVLQATIGNGLSFDPFSFCQNGWTAPAVDVCWGKIADAFVVGGGYSRQQRRIASPEMFPEAEMLPHLICSRPILIGGANDEADQHGDA
jgi:hypothetical protein